MLSTVELDDQLLFYAYKINDVRRNRVLPAKLESTKPAVSQL
jgi:hypothetical protein